MRKFGWMCAMSLVLVACGGDEVKPETNEASGSITKPGGKADLVILDRICIEEGFGTGCDLCEEYDWYNDGVCDEFCQNPDPDCGPVIEPGTCDWNASSPLGETSEDVSKLVVGSTRFTDADLGELTTVQTHQIFEAMMLLGMLDAEDDFDMVFKAADEGIIDILEVSAEGLDYHWVSFYAGDTEVGVIFEASTLRRVGEISDGDLLACAPGEPEPAVDPFPPSDPDPAIDPQPTPDQVTCSYDEPWALAQDSDTLGEKAISRQEFSKDDLEQIEHNTANQIYFALVHLQLLTGTEDLAMIFDAVDEGLFEVITVEGDEGRFQWISCYAGDTEVGAVFKEDTLTIVAEISDGDILSCQ